jgi:hypothetical protein
MVLLSGNTTLTSPKLTGQTTLTSAKLNAGSLADAGIDFTLEESVDTEEVIAGTSGAQTTVNDILFDTETGATTETHSHLLATGNESFEFASQDTNIATVNSNTGITAWVSNGTARMLCKGTHIWKHKNVAVSRAGGQSVSVFNSYLAGSFAKYCSDSVDNAISGKNMAAHGSLFTSMNHGTATYVRNASNWATAAGIDCTGISPWNSRGGVYQHGTALHERIAIFAYHYSDRVQIGDTVRFVTAGNVVVDRVIDAVSPQGAAGSPMADCYLVRFSQALPGTIGIVKVLPSNWATYLPSLGTTTMGYRIPGPNTDQEKKALVWDLRRISTASAGWDEPENATRVLFYEDGIGGDSGAPQCLVAGTQLVYISSFSSTAIPSSTNLASVDSLMGDLLTGAATTKISLSSYNPY